MKWKKRGWRSPAKGVTCEQDAVDHPWHHHENMGSSFMYPHMMQPAFTCDMFLAEAALHNDLPGKAQRGAQARDPRQHVLTTPAPTTTPGHQPGTPTSPRLSRPQTIGACPAFLNPTSCTKGRRPCSSLARPSLIPGPTAGTLVCAPVPQGDGWSAQR